MKWLLIEVSVVLVLAVVIVVSTWPKKRPPAKLPANPQDYPNADPTLPPTAKSNDDSSKL